jgi:hypothetical protein
MLLRNFLILETVVSVRINTSFKSRSNVRKIAHKGKLYKNNSS